MEEGFTDCEGLFKAPDGGLGGEFRGRRRWWRHGDGGVGLWRYIVFYAVSAEAAA